MATSNAALFFLVGPTAVGKTALSLEWAERLHAEILSCDAFCVYRGMNVGTAKPTAAERTRVPHHGIDLVPVAEPFSVGAYAEMARRVVGTLHSRGRNVLVAGGSGFYLKSFFAPVVDNVGVTPEVRERVAYLFETEGLDGLMAELLRCNPAGLGDLDTKNPRRVARALERCLASGRPMDELKAAFAGQPPPFPGVPRRVVLLERSMDDLERRIAARTAAMLEGGLIDEVRQLLDEGLRGNPTAARAIGYRETIAHLDGVLDRTELEAAINRNTRRLVKKQLTWFRTQIPVNVRLRAAPDKGFDLSNIP